MVLKHHIFVYLYQIFNQNIMATNENLSENEKWFNKKWLVYLLLIIFPPVGLFALWKSENIKKTGKIVWGIVSFFLLFMYISVQMDNRPVTVTYSKAEENPSHKDEETGPTLEELNKQAVTASDLMAEYEANEVSADQKYKGKTFYVSGRIESIGKDFTDDIYVTLKTGDQYGISKIQCMIDDPEVTANLRKGQGVIISGSCRGLTMMTVLMRDCSIAAAE